jgi:hypothetical protein
MGDSFKEGSLKPHKESLLEDFFFNSNKETSLQKGVVSAHTQSHPKKPVDL